LELNGRCHLLVHAEYVNTLGRNTNIVARNTETLIVGMLV